MKPSMIFQVLDLAREALKNGRSFNPLLIGQAGLGKSEICQQWAKDRGIPFFDLRLAYMEGPDFIGLPKIVAGKEVEFVTEHIIPAMWDKLKQSKEGLLLIEEPNRANSSVLNCLMQVLTDNKVHEFELPKGWIKCGVINPDSAGYDVNTLDTALRDRFVPYEVEYDHVEFVQFMKDNKWHPRLISFIESGVWTYKTAEEISGDSKYIAPRTYNYLNNAELNGLDKNHDLHMQTSIAQLGKVVGREYFNFTFNQKPVTADDIMKNPVEAFERLAKYMNPYRGDLISVTVNSMLESFLTNPKVDTEFVAKVCAELPADQAIALISACTNKSAAFNKTGKAILFPDFLKAYPPLGAKLKILKTEQSVRTEKSDVGHKTSK